MGVLELDNAIVIGHSLGSFVAREVARRAPRQVSRLVLVGSGAWANNEGMNQLRDLIHSFGEQIPAAFIDEFQRSTFSRPLPDEFLTAVMAASASVPPRVWRDGIDGLIAFDDRRRLRQLRLPTLLIWGEQDQVFTRTDQEALLDGIPGSRLVAYGGIGHAPHWEVPEAFVADLLAFVEEDQERR
jgi:pimeloyl-ACP methyl ester carboxylesterase